MTVFQTIIQKISNVGSLITGIINWKLKNPVTEDEKAKVNVMCRDNYYIILTRNNNHLSSYIIGLGDFFLEHKFGFWGHALMNTEDKVVNDTDFRFVEAIGSGVQYATFEEVMAVNSIVLLKPKNLSADEWAAVLEKAYKDVGKPYDTFFDLHQSSKLSCVELVRDALMAEPNYSTDFANFEAMVQKYNRVTPQMFYDCPDFEVVYETRH
jgi:hypothetical protein